LSKTKPEANEERTHTRRERDQAQPSPFFDCYQRADRAHHRGAIVALKHAELPARFLAHQLGRPGRIPDQFDLHVR